PPHISGVALKLRAASRRIAPPSGAAAPAARFGGLVLGALPLRGNRPTGPPLPSRALHPAAKGLRFAGPLLMPALCRKKGRAMHGPLARGCRGRASSPDRVRAEPGGPLPGVPGAEPGLYADQLVGAGSQADLFGVLQ